MNKKLSLGVYDGIRFLNRLLTVLALIIVWSIGVIGVQAQGTSSTLTIDLSKPGHAISPILYNGELFEEIGRGVDGGFYAQLINNYSFEDNNPLDGWSLVNPGSVRGATLRRDFMFNPQGSSHGALYAQTSGQTGQLNSNQFHCLKLDITSVSSGSVGAANAGYWGIRLDNNTMYKVSFFARKDANFNGTITVKLESNEGKVYASSDIFTPTTSWQKFTCDLVTNDISADRNMTDGIGGNNRFVIYGSTTGSLYFDVVRVMPPTYKDRPNGMRLDLANLQAALNPKLIRFPGGCDVEHSSVEGGWNWKNAIGPIEQRPGVYEQRWGYHNSQQFGLDDMLQMCEDCGAEPIYCCNSGLNAEDSDTAQMDKIQPFIQEVLDLIEYANGDAQTNKWGKLRAANGHPAPYNLKYIEVGNEKGVQKGYMERYALFYNAIKKAYPDMNLIINGILGNQKADIIDEHFFRTFDELLKLSTRYDSYDRKGPKIVVGEYSNRENRTEVGNLQCAIGEAAFLTGCERNSDIVISTTYGTLSSNVNLNNFFPNLYYNNSVT
ncbi:MAG: hypothetical protein NT144_05705, partial [Bacteroidia bacterium]|nr:hypothetical protein [Bacteroidia bacterium]